MSLQSCSFVEPKCVAPTCQTWSKKTNSCSKVWKLENLSLDAGEYYTPPDVWRDRWSSIVASKQKESHSSRLLKFSTCLLHWNASFLATANQQSYLCAWFSPADSWRGANLSIKVTSRNMAMQQKYCGNQPRDVHRFIPKPKSWWLTVNSHSHELSWSSCNVLQWYASPTADWRWQVCQDYHLCPGAACWPPSQLSRTLRARGQSGTGHWEVLSCNEMPKREQGPVPL